MKTRQIAVDGKQIGIVGLDEVMEELYQSGGKPDGDSKDYLLVRLKALNYIPSGKEDIYAACFLEEYRRFCDLKKAAPETEKKDLGTWRGIPREEIPWYPTIMDDLCDGCGICVRFCSHEVYECDEKANKVRVINPFNCVVGCSMCALKCKPKAIVFPPLEVLEAFRKR
ncbi:MAG: hypothetical protein WCE90_05330 [Candidatus Zixiibacteriota bacterium]